MVILNNSPVLSLSEIIIKIFKNEFLSDCVFTFESEEHILHVHSFLLCARSIVFEKQFESICDQDQPKMIPITDYSYEIFSQFMSFIYTDECTVTKENVIALLELALKYKIPKLENSVNRFIIDHNLEASENLRIYQFCVTKSYQLLRNWIADIIGSQLSYIIKSDLFLEIESDTLEEILKMDTVGTCLNPVQEIDIFKALMRWLERYSVKNNANLDERRCKFNQLKGAIRFPVMMIAELKEILSQHENLLTDLDLVSFFASTANNGQVWNCNKRNVYPFNLNEVNNSRASKLFVGKSDSIKTMRRVNLPCRFPVIKEGPIKKNDDVQIPKFPVPKDDRFKEIRSVSMPNSFPVSKYEPIKKTSGVQVGTFFLPQPKDDPFKETSSLSMPNWLPQPINKTCGVEVHPFPVSKDDAFKETSSISMPNWLPVSKYEAINKTSGVQVQTFPMSKDDIFKNTSSVNFANALPIADRFNFKLQNSIGFDYRNLVRFTPDKDLLLTGIWLKVSLSKLATIIVKCDDAEILKLPVNAPSYETILCLGESMRLKADKKYKIMIDGEMDFKGGAFNKLVLKRRDVIETDIAKCLRDVKVSNSVAQIFFCIPSC